MVEVGQRVPSFSLPSTGDPDRSLKDFKGRRLVVYFYPKDNTPGCTREGQDFRDQHDAFSRLNTDILGISRDSVKVHENFSRKHDFPFELGSDADEQVCKLFDVIKEKNMYGRKYMGIERSTFLIDEKGVLRQEWRKVRVPGHVDAVLDAVRELDAS